MNSLDLCRDMAIGRTVAITGASAGVGRATALRFARKGWQVGLLARGRAGLHGTATEVRRAGGRPHAVVCDVADADQVDTAATEIEEALGPVDVWVNNAMVTVYGRFEDLTVEEFRRVVDVTFFGSVWGTRTALERMGPRGRGVIVQVGSALSERGIPLQSAYCASKHALNGVLDSIRTELLADDRGIDVCVVQMPALNTPQFTWGRNKMDEHPQPVPPIFQPEVAAEAVWHVAHHPRKELWVGRSTVQTILADRVASSLLDQYLAETGIESQQTGEPGMPNRPDNLHQPADDDHDVGARGPFDDRSRNRSLQLQAVRHRGALAMAGAALAAAGVATAWMRSDHDGQGR